MDSFVPWILAAVSFPVMFLKQILNFMQLVMASQKLAEGDREARRKAGLPRKKSQKKRN